MCRKSFSSTHRNLAGRLRSKARCDTEKTKGTQLGLRHHRHSGILI